MSNLEKLQAVFDDAIASLPDSGKLAGKPTAEPQRRTICKRFYVSAAEDEQIQRSRQGVNESRFFRSRVLGVSIPRPRSIIPQINLDTYTELAILRAQCTRMAAALQAAEAGQRSPIDQACLNQLTQLESLLASIQLQLSQAIDSTRSEDGVANDRKD